MDGPPPLAVRGLTVRYRARPALSRVDLEAGRGEFLALAGPNGSGKTTLIRAVLGFLAPSEGRVELFGTPVETLTPRERARWVAWVPQEEAPRDDLPLLDYVLLGRYAHQGMLEGESPEDRRLAQALLEEIGMADRASDGVLSISGGERQRVVLARALAQEPQILLLDEPTSHLDIGHQLDVLGRVRAMARARGTTVVAAMHDLNLAARFADRIVVLSRGHRVANGPPAEVLSEQMLRSVWGVAAELKRDPRTGTPFLIPYPLPTPRATSGTHAPRGIVHVVGGGGAAGPVLRALTDRGFPVTAGALHLLDSDTETAEALGIPTVQEVPFAPLSDEARRRHRDQLREASAIVVAPFAVGPSNLANLEDLRPFVGERTIYLLSRPPISQRDFTEGEASRRYAELVALGAKECPSLEDVLARLGALAAAGEPPALDGLTRSSEERGDV